MLRIRSFFKAALRLGPPFVRFQLARIRKTFSRSLGRKQRTPGRLAEAAETAADWSVAARLWDDAFQFSRELSTPLLLKAIRSARDAGDIARMERYAHAAIESTPSDLRLASAYADASFLAGNWDEAAERWRAVVNLGNGRVRPRHLRQLARALERSGDTMGASKAWKEAVEANPGDFRLFMEYLGYLERTRKTLVVRAECAARLEIEEAEVHRCVLGAKLLKLHFLEGRKPEWSAVKSMLGGAGSLELPEKLTMPAIVSVSGYYYSGSSAVIDFIRGDGTSAWPSEGEFRILSQYYGFHALAMEGDPWRPCRPVDVVRLILHFFGQIPEAQDEIHKFIRRRKGLQSNLSYEDVILTIGVLNRSAIKAALNDYAWVESFCSSLMEVSVAANADPTLSCHEFFSRALRVFLMRLAAKKAGTERLVLDQAVHVENLEACELLPPAKIIFVHRDPRDQYADIVNARRRQKKASLQMSAFVEMYRRRRAMVEKGVKLMRSYGHEVRLVGFEEFVLDQGERTDVGDWLGLPRNRKPAAAFRVEDSQRNVGIYRDALSRGEIAEIESALPDYLFCDRASGGPY